MRYTLPRVTAAYMTFQEIFRKMDMFNFSGTAKSSPHCMTYAVPTTSLIKKTKMAFTDKFSQWIMCQFYKPMTTTDIELHFHALLTRDYTISFRPKLLLSLGLMA